MAHIEHTLAGQEANTLPQGSGVGTDVDEAVGTQSTGDGEEAGPSASVQVDIPDPHPAPSPSLLSPPPAALTPTSNRPPLIQHSSSQSHSGSSTPTTTTAPHPKKFSSININKKFLEKTTSASAATTMTTASSTSKTTGNGISRPPTQTSSAHPRLVTTKLTATVPSPSSVAGWSRPSSTAPPAPATGTNSPNGTTPTSSATSATLCSVSAPTAPQLPHSGKVIQPVPRSALGHQPATPNTGPSKESSSNAPSGPHNKPVWGNIKPPQTTVSRPDVKANDFPTAAEVAQGTRKSKSTEQPTQEASAASSPTMTTKPSRKEEADTFRGVHLDPNAHHWDEMVEDDDNYWDNVIEFDDGRRYKVEVAEQTSSKSREPSPPASIKSSKSTRLEPDVPVSKEERFADDFDRSWPSGPRRGPSASTQQRSPQEPPRVLFNERSNKLEPYSSHRLGHGAFPSKRGGFQDRTVSPVEPRSASTTFHGLSKGSGGPPDFGSSRSRRLSSASNSSFVPPTDRDRPRDRDRRDGIPSSPRIPKDVIGLPGRPPSLRGRERDNEKDSGNLDRGRHSTMGPPPIPGHAWRNASRESVRQRLSSSGSVNGAALLRRYPHQDEPSEFQGSSPTVARGPPHSPALSHASLSTKAPVMSPATSPLALPAHDLEELKKDVMHSAAERAKQRRQQEEEEREAQKERARKKAAELEAKMKAEAEAEEQREQARKEAELEAKMKAEAEEKAQRDREVEKAQRDREVEQAKKEQEQLETRQQEDGGADKNIEAGPAALDGMEKTTQGTSDAEVQKQLSTSKPPQRRPSGPLQHSSSGGPSRRVTPTAGPSSGTNSTAETAETWRRAAPSPQPDEPRSIQRRFSNSVAFIPPPPLDTLADGKQDLEVVDFSDMGRFVGETTTELKETPKKTSRPVASDFFDDVPSSSLSSRSLSPTAKNDIDTWRRKASLNKASASEQQVKGVSSKDRPEGNAVVDSSEQAHRINEGPVDGRQPSQVSPPTQRPPRSQNFYHQAPMSSLVDAMSRIKGALHDMQVEESNKETHLPEAEVPPTAPTQSIQIPSVSVSKPKDKWVPPSLRGRMIEFQEENPEEYYRTMAELPPSPRPALGSFTVNLPSESRHREPVPRRQLFLFSRPPPPVHWSILSFEPPVEGMNKRNLSVNDVLFRPFVGFKNKTKYRVQLPRSKPRVHSPGQISSRTNSFGTFGKQNGADSSSSWRKPTSPHPPPSGIGGELMSEVNTTSRSPPPEPEPSSPTLAINLKTDASSTENSAPLSRIRSQPKMPEGSSVGFYREPEAEPKTLVSFIVSSEIDDPQSSQASEDDMTVEASTTNDAVEESTSEKATGLPKPNEGEVGDEKAGADPETDWLPDTKRSEKSSHQSSPWLTSRSLPVKESPARAPDPELLKAVWSQTSNKAGSRTINSLEGIADDLTALPFTIQDVKSEGGETPPPAPGVSSSRISLHDVTRAFQQVPSSSSSAPHKPSISPPSTTAPVARPSNYPYPTPPNNMRPTYPAYPSPMMSHSPSPTMMYPHMVSSPVPARMQVNGHPPMYNPPMWVPVQPPTQVSNGMMRPIGAMASPYAPPLMAYTPNGGPTMYTHGIPVNMPGTPQAQNMQPNRNRNMPVMSPVMQHAGGHMYPASPAMMHMQMTPTSGYNMPLPTGRGQPRPENGMHQPSSIHPSSSQVGFGPVPPSPFMRNW